MSLFSIVGNRVDNSASINLPNIKASSNRFEVITSGVSQLFIDSAGKVGIGTSNPNHLLHLYQPDTNDVNIKITNDVSTDGLLFGLDSNNDLQIKHRDNGEIQFFTNDNQQVMIGVSGAVGIGTGNPNDNLHIHENSSDQSYIRFTNSTTSSGCTVGLDGGEAFVIRHRDNEQIKFYTNDTQRFLIGSDGVLEPFGQSGIFKFNSFTTTEKNGISAETGMVVFDTTLSKLSVYTGSVWESITST